MQARYGMVHGRFQPFHCGHLQYTLAALARCDHLLVGITNPDPSLIVAEPTDPERHHPAANVFTFFERQCMIRAALAEAGVGAAALAATEGVETVPLSSFYATQSKRSGLVLGFAAFDEREIHVGVQKFARALALLKRE